MRFNGAYTQTADERAHSEGEIRYSQFQLNWQPFAGTELKASSSAVIARSRTA